MCIRDSTITDLSSNDVLIVGSGATANASNISSFTANSSTTNAGTANLTAASSGATINVSSAGSGGFNLIGGAGTDILTGGSGVDTFTVAASGEANSDTLNGGGGTDSLVLSGGTHIFSDNSKISNIESVTLNNSGTDLNLSSQSEGFTIVGAAGVDVIRGGAGNDNITGNGSSDTFHILSGTDTVTDLSTGDIFIVSSGAVLDTSNISGFVATNASSNAGVAHLRSDNSGVTIDMRLSSSGGYNITGGSGADTFYGGTGQDTFIISAAGHQTSDTYDGCLLYTSDAADE